jgi:hypothetical protein
MTNDPAIAKKRNDKRKGRITVNRSNLVSHYDQSILVRYSRQKEKEMEEYQQKKNVIHSVIESLNQAEEMTRIKQFALRPPSVEISIVMSTVNDRNGCLLPTRCKKL